VPNLIGVADRHYLDRTGLQQQHSIVDLMRYAALNQGADGLASFDGNDWPPAPFGMLEKPACCKSLVEDVPLVDSDRIPTAKCSGAERECNAASEARFGVGEYVQRLNQPESTEHRWDSQVECWNYLVPFGAQLRAVPEENLEPVRVAQSPWDSLERSSLSGKAHFVITLTYERLKSPPARIAHSFVIREHSSIRISSTPCSSSSATPES
jgi:hypothetical protein